MGSVVSLGSPNWILTCPQVLNRSWLPSEAGAQMPNVSLISSMFLTVLVVFASIGGLIVVRRWLHVAELRENHDVTDPMSQVVGMMFAVLLGFMVSDAMQRFEGARATVQQEAASLADIFQQAHGLSAESRSKIYSLCSQYADLVVSEEWPLLAQRRTSIKTWRIYNQLWIECTDLKPKTQSESNIQQTMLQSMSSMGDCRRLRIEALHNGLSPVLWGVLIVGGFTTVLFTYFFGIQNLRMQIIMTSIVSLVICLNIFLLACYDDPFSGDVMVYPSAFVVDQKIFKMCLDPKVEYENW
jgi:hypothetical protein